MSNAQRLLDMLPPHFASLRQMREVAKAQSVPFDKLDNDVDSFLNQGFINTATWGIHLWEQRFLVQNSSGSLEQRRSRILEAKARTRGDFMELLRRIEPNIELKWNGLILDFTINQSQQNIFDSMTLIQTIEREKPAHLDVIQNINSLYETSIFVGGGVTLDYQQTSIPTNTRVETYKVPPEKIYTSMPITLDYAQITIPSESAGLTIVQMPPKEINSAVGITLDYSQITIKGGLENA